MQELCQMARLEIPESDDETIKEECKMNAIIEAVRYYMSYVDFQPSRSAELARDLHLDHRQVIEALRLLERNGVAQKLQGLWGPTDVGFDL